MNLWLWSLSITLLLLIAGLAAYLLTARKYQSASSELAENMKLHERELAAVRKDFSQQEDHIAALQRDLVAKDLHIQCVSCSYKVAG